MLDHLIPVDRQVDGPAHIDIAGEIISQRHSVLISLPHWDHRQVEASVVHGLTCQQGKSVHGLIRVCRGGVSEIHLTGECRRVGCVLVHK